MESIFVKILFILFIGVIVYILFNVFNKDYTLTHQKCQMENFDIDDLIVIKRTPEYSNLIDKMVEDKSFIFNDQQLKVLKNPQQIFEVKSNNKNDNNIKNISDIIYTNCKDKLDNQVNNDYTDNPIDVSDNEYNQIKNMLKNDINKLTGPNCFNTGVLSHSPNPDIPNVKNYLKNYYQDIYGNKIDANLSDYFTAYYTLINQDDNVGLPVNTMIGHSNFVIPDQYRFNSKLTNAYNIDWNRIINPISYSI